VPIADHFVTSGIHVHAGLAGKKQHDKSGEKHHVASEAEENKEPDLMQALTRPPMLTLPVVIASAAPASGRSPVYRGLPANSRFFPFDFRRGSRKSNGHLIAPLC
jgi:hypothetical protein